MDLVDAIRRLCTATGLSLAQVVEMLLRKSLAGGVLTVESPEQRVARVLRGDS
jgi:hypothetical protein